MKKLFTCLLILTASTSKSFANSKEIRIIVECKGSTNLGTKVSATLCLVEIAPQTSIREFEITSCGHGDVGIFLAKFSKKDFSDYDSKFFDSEMFKLTAEGTDDAFVVVASDRKTPKKSPLLSIEIPLDFLGSFMKLNGGLGWVFTFRKASCEIE